MALIHIGDTHGRFDVLDKVIDDCEKLAVGAWLWPGDVFDSRSTVDMRNALSARVRRMAALAPVVIVQGNHDVDGDLDIFGDLETEWAVHVISTPTVLRLVTAPNRDVVMCFALPWPTPAGLVAQGVSQQDLPVASRAALEAIFVDAGNELAKARADGRLVMAIGHAEVTGSVRATGQPAVGHEIALDQGLLSHLGDCYIGLNHVHNAQEVGAANYAGSICRLSWGEIDPKSYTVVTYQEDGKFVWERKPVNVPPMWHLECELSRHHGVTNMNAVAGPDGKFPPMEPMTYDKPWSGCDVRLRASYKQSEGIVLAEAQAQAKAMFTHAHRFEFEPVCVPDRAVRAPQVAIARTLGEKVEAWAEVAGAALPSDVADKLKALESMDADQLVLMEEQRLAYMAAGQVVAAKQDDDYSLIG